MHWGFLEKNGIHSKGLWKMIEGTRSTQTSPRAQVHVNFDPQCGIDKHSMSFKFTKCLIRCLCGRFDLHPKIWLITTNVQEEEFTWKEEEK